jgi:hypothetical protein
MSHPEPSGPDLDGVVADANAVGLPYVVIGGFSVIANGFVRAGGEQARFASHRSIVGFKRLAGRPQDKRDLEELEAFNGELPIDPIPGLDE